MDKKEFKQITTKVFEEYGFVKKGKLYYLDLDEIIICSGFLNAYGIPYLTYTFSIKAIHTQDEYKLNDMFEGFDSMLIDIEYDETAHIYQRRNLYPEQYDPEEYRQKLRKLLHKYFDPYRVNAIEWIIRGHYEIGLINENTVEPLRIKAKQYLELDGFKF